MNYKQIHRAYFKHFSAAAVFIEAAAMAGYRTQHMPLKKDDGSFKGWLVTWLQ
jgi:hypothetical protein